MASLNDTDDLIEMNRSRPKGPPDDMKMHRRIELEEEEVL